MENRVKVILFGPSPIGKLIAKGILEKKGLKVVGAIDILKDIVGKDIGEVFGATFTSLPSSVTAFV
jgi:hypothetical protein